MRIVIIAVALFLIACSEKSVYLVNQKNTLQPSEQFEISKYIEQRAKSVKEIWKEEKGSTIKRIAYLPEFNSNDLNDWKALIQYGKKTIGRDEQHTEILYFVLDDNAQLPVNFSKFNEQVNNEIFAQFNSWSADDALLFQVNIYSSFDE